MVFIVTRFTLIALPLLAISALLGSSSQASATEREHSGSWTCPGTNITVQAHVLLEAQRICAATRAPLAILSKCGFTQRCRLAIEVNDDAWEDRTAGPSDSPSNFDDDDRAIERDADDGDIWRADNGVAIPLVSVVEASDIKQSCFIL